MHQPPPPSSSILDLSTDGHVHTYLCNHAVGTMEEYVKAGLSKGLKRLIFLEHLETDIRTLERIWLRPEDFEYYFREGERLKKRYKGSIDITLGIEAGLNPARIDEIDTTLKTYGCDHVGLSYHFFFNDAYHLNMVSRRQENIDALVSLGTDKVLTTYFDDLQMGIEAIEGIQVVCHLDAVLRHHPSLVIQETHWSRIESILDLMAAKNIALEINTSGFAIAGRPYPNKRLLKLARCKNIRFIAGSDAHRPEQVGRYFTEIPSLFT